MRYNKITKTMVWINSLYILECLDTFHVYLDAFHVYLDAFHFKPFNWLNIKE